MDDSVERALLKWPGVPDVFGWLGLDQRGRWLLRGSPVTNTRLTGFLGRNYASDETGRWFCQNGPQRVFVHLDCTPWVWFINQSGEKLHCTSHTGREANQIYNALVDETGALLLETDIGIGVVCDRDIMRIPLSIAAQGTELPIADSLGAGYLDWNGTSIAIEPAVRAQLPMSFHFILNPG